MAVSFDAQAASTALTAEEMEAIELASIVHSQYQNEPCGICRKQDPPATTFWITHFSKTAHSDCYEAIKPLEADLTTTINSLFDLVRDQNTAHSIAIEAVTKQLGKVSIKEFLETNGAKKLLSIFNSHGIPAVKRLTFTVAKEEELSKFLESFIASIP